MKLATKATIFILAVMIMLITVPTIQGFARGKAIEIFTNDGSGAQCMATIESSTGRILYGKNLDKKRPMASTTKIITAITVINNCTDLEKVVSVPAKAVGVEGSSIYLQKDEKVKIIDLLYGLMLQSGNDCAETLAITTAGSIEDFALLMNKTATAAGANNSNFVNPHGLHNDNHYTTARDLALITAYSFKNETFKKIVSTRKHTMPWAGRTYDRVLMNKNKILNTFDGGDGVKTGFTKKAGRCLVSSATRNGMQVICVVLNCGPMFEECSAFMERAFKEYKMTTLAESGECVGEVPVTGGKQNKTDIGIGGNFCYPLKENELQSVRREIETVQSLTAPIKKGVFAGKIKIYLENQLLFDEKLFSIESVDGLSVWDKLKDLVHGWNN